MKKTKVFYDKEGNSLVVWFDDPKKETVCEEIGEDIVLMKDKKGKVIGLEKLNYIIPFKKSLENPSIEVASI